ncbi:MAG: hypothetical protein DMF96_01590 [Acidobacteria bacterium]|nr:MAG: hypothetical protein DMF96_01590 [Acidobacteriota bacterium]
MTRSKLIFLAVLFLARPVFAQTDVTGDWDVTVNSPQGANTTLVTLKQDGEKVSGIFKSQQGQLPFEGGTLTGSDLTFTFTVTTQGMQIPITLTGKVEGATMTGKADFGGFAQGDWTAKRSAATETSTSTPTTPPATTTATTSTTTTGLGGKWDVTLKTPGGDFPASANLTDDGGKLTGTFGSQMGEVAITGTVEGKAVKISMVARTPQGDLNVEMTGDLDGDSIVNGKAEIAGMGQMEWTAKRAKP